MLQAMKNFFLPEDDRLRSLIRRFKEDLKYTPDLGYLEMYQTQLVLVTDDLQEGFPNHKLIQEQLCSNLGHAFTREDYLLWKKDLGKDSYSVPIKAVPEDAQLKRMLPHLPHPAKIKGELYAIRPRGFIELDKLRLNGVQFRRKRIGLNAYYHELRQREWIKHLSETERALRNPEEEEVYLTKRLAEPITAWMYVANAEYWNPQKFQGLVPVRTFSPHDENLERYSQFTRAELQPPK